MEEHPLPDLLLLMDQTRSGGKRRRPSVALKANRKVRLRLDSFLETFVPNLSKSLPAPAEPDDPDEPEI